MRYRAPRTAIGTKDGRFAHYVSRERHTDVYKRQMLAAVGSAVAQALGGWDVALKVLICFMALDYVTGWLVAAVWHKSAKSKTGALDSKASYKGLVKKGVMLSLVWMAALLDQATRCV